MKNTIKWAKQSLVKHTSCYIIVVIQIVMVDHLRVLWFLNFTQHFAKFYQFSPVKHEVFAHANNEISKLLLLLLLSFSPLVIIQNVVNRMRKILLPKRRNISLFIKVCKIWQPVIQAESSQLKLDPAVVAAGWCEAKGGLVWKPILGFSGPDIRVAWPGPDHWW